MFIVFMLLAATGILSNNIMQMMKNRKLFTIYYLLGMNWHKCVAVEICRTIFLIGFTMALSIVVTTHSSHFMEALEYYSKKHDIVKKCNYYLASAQENGLCKFTDATKDTDEIYRQMVHPSILLDKLNYELEEKNDD